MYAFCRRISFSRSLFFEARWELTNLFLFQVAYGQKVCWKKTSEWSWVTKGAVNCFLFSVASADTHRSTRVAYGENKIDRNKHDNNNTYPRSYYSKKEPSNTHFLAVFIIKLLEMDKMSEIKSKKLLASFPHTWIDTPERYKV